MRKLTDAKTQRTTIGTAESQDARVEEKIPRRIKCEIGMMLGDDAPAPQEGEALPPDFVDNDHDGLS